MFEVLQLIAAFEIVCFCYKIILTLQNFDAISKNIVHKV